MTGLSLSVSTIPGETTNLGLQWKCFRKSDHSDVLGEGSFGNPYFGPFYLPVDSSSNRYHSNMECWFNFTAHATSCVYVFFSPCELDTGESSTECNKDSFVVPMLAGHKKVCGAPPQNEGATFTDLDRVELYFTSDASGEKVGCAGAFISCKHQGWLLDI